MFSAGHGRRIAGDDVIAKDGAHLRGVPGEQRGDARDAERAAELAEEIVQSNALRKLHGRQLGERDAS